MSLALDFRTLYITTGILAFTLALFMTLAMKGKGRGPEFSLYALALFSLFIGEALVGTQGFLHDIFSVILGNAGILMFFALSYHGLAIFMHGKLPRWHFLVVAAVMALPFAFFTFIMPIVSVRVIIFSLVALTYCLAFLGLLLGEVRRQLGLNWILVCAVGCGILLSLLWLVDALFLRTPNEEITKGGPVRAVTIIATIPLIVGMVLGLLTLASQKAEKARLESEALSHSFFEYAPDAILISDIGGRFVDANSAACALYGYARDQLLGMNAADLGDAPPAQAVLQEGRYPVEGYIETTRRNSKGRDLLVELVSARIPYGGKTVVMDISRDLTSRRAVERDLRLSEKRYRSLIATVSDIVWEVDLEGRFRYVSDKVRDILGYEPESMLGRSLFETLSEEQHASARAKMAELANTRGSFSGLLSESLHVDGRMMVFESSGVAARGPNGEISGFWICSRDVTERTRVEEALRASEERLRTIIDSSMAGITLISPEGVITFANQRMADLFKQPLEALIGSDYESHVQPRENDKSREALLDGSLESLSAERRYTCADGSEFWGLATSRRIYDSRGRFTSVISILMDYTDLRTAEEALRRSEEHHRNTFENAPFGIARSTVGGRLIDANPAFARILGYASTDELLDALKDSTVGQVIYEDPEERSRIMQGVLNRTGWQQFNGVRMRRRDGMVAVTNLSVRVLGTPRGTDPELEVFIEDITERTRVEAERARLQVQFQQAQKMEAVGRLAGGIAHDFNNLLTVILGYSDMAIVGAPAADNGRMYLAGIADAARRAARLTSQLLAFSRKQILQPKLIDMGELITGMADMLRRLLGEDIELRVLRTRELWRVHADPGQVEQVVMNLAVNARDAMPDGGTLILETSNTSLDDAYAREHVDAREGSCVLLSVTDSGIGMDGATLAQIFEPFFTTKEVGRGTGLGLATVYGIVKQSGGHIACYSEPGRGTTFRVFLPRAREDAAEGKADSGEQAPARGGTETILLVEDDVSVRGFSGLLLKQAGYSVLAAGDGSEAIRLLANARAAPAILITDVVMPGMDGRMVAQAVQELYPGLPVLFLSGYTEDAIVQRGVLELGVQFIPKPFTADALLSKVRTLLDGR